MAAPPPKKGRLSLYEDRISDSARAEIQAREDQKLAAEAAKKKKDASFLFKPTSLGKKPNNNSKAKPKPKPNFTNMHKMSSSTSTSAGDAPTGLASSDAPTAPAPAQKRNFDDWLANDDDDFEYHAKPQQNRNAKKWKKNYNKKDKSEQQQTWTYDDIYDPSKPVNLAHYPQSEAAFQTEEAWKMRLYNANKKERHRTGQTAKERPTAKEFAPPGKQMFAPPPELISGGDVRPQSSGSSSYRRDESDRDYDELPRATFSKMSFAPPASLAPTANLNKEETADEAYARRLALSSGGSVAPAPPVSDPQQTPTIPEKVATPEELEKRAQASAKIAAFKEMMAAKAAGKEAAAKLTKPVPVAVPVSEPMPGFVPSTVPERKLTPQEELEALDEALKQHDVPERDHSPEVIVTTNQQGIPSSRGPIDSSKLTPGFGPSISGAPTYNYGFPGIAPAMDARIATQTPPSIGAAAPPPAAEEEAEESSKRPGQTGFAERLLRKMGWEKGQGLGASNDGITSAIIMKADKSSKKRPIGKITGGKKKATDEKPDETSHGVMSEVIKLEGMLKGLDVDKEIEENDLLQEIGQEMGENYGKVERLFIWRGHMGGNEEVFVKFTSQLSALRAVKGMDGVEFVGNMVKGRFWDTAKFEAGEYC